MSVDFNQLNSIQSVTFSQFKSDYLNGYDRAYAYYQNLKAQAQASGYNNVANYADMASQVTTNSGMSIDNHRYA